MLWLTWITVVNFKISICVIHDRVSSVSLQMILWKVIYLNCGERYEAMIEAMAVQIQAWTGSFVCVHNYGDQSWLHSLMVAQRQGSESSPLKITLGNSKNPEVKEIVWVDFLT